MNTEDLTEYINILADMENGIYIQKRILKMLKTKASKLCVPMQFKEPVKPSASGMFDLSKNTLSLIGIVVFVCIVFWAGIHVDHMSFFLAILCLFGALVCPFIFIGVLIDTINKNKKNNTIQASFNKELITYNQNLSNYNDLVAKDQKRIDEERKQLDFLNKEISSAEKSIHESSAKLRKMYEIGIVFPKYRNMVMINTISEYLQAGRCSELKGPDGAYNILENEIRLNHIAVTLEEAVSKLEEIKNNQYMIYSAIREGNQTLQSFSNKVDNACDQIGKLNRSIIDYSDQIEEIRNNTGLISYNTDRINKELHYMNRMKYFANEYNGTIFNQLP